MDSIWHVFHKLNDNGWTSLFIAVIESQSLYGNGLIDRLVGTYCRSPMTLQ